MNIKWIRKFPPIAPTSKKARIALKSIVWNSSEFLAICVKCRTSRCQKISAENISRRVKDHGGPSAQWNFSEQSLFPSRNFHIAFSRGSTFRLSGYRRNERGIHRVLDTWNVREGRGSLPPWLRSLVSCHRSFSTPSLPPIDRQSRIHDSCLSGRGSIIALIFSLFDCRHL